jgi:GT2 family glycosyltransferase
VLASRYDNKEVIVADNCSADDSISFLGSAYPGVRIIRHPVNYGFTRGYNEALKAVTADYYIILNSDVEVEPGWITPMVELLESDPAIAACQPKILQYHNRKQFEYAGGAGGWIDSAGYPFTKGRIFEVFENDEGQYDRAEPIFWASGAAMFIRASVFHAAGGFDNYFFAHQEEIDLCWRVQLMGYRVYSCPASVIYHVGGGTLPRGNNRKVFLNFRNNRIMLAKNLPWSGKFWKIPLRAGLDMLSACKGLLSGQGGYFAAIMKAELGFWNWVFFKKSRSVFPPAKKGALRGVYRGNIVWQHFIRRKNYFREIIK